jgi:hypothetical protein
VLLETSTMSDKHGENLRENKELLVQIIKATSHMSESVRGRALTIAIIIMKIMMSCSPESGTEKR